MVLIDHDSPSTIRAILVHNYLHMFAVSCLYYDHLVTAGQEIDYLWKRPKNRSSFWFFVNRYFAFFGNIAVTILGFSDLSVQVCKRYNIFRQLLLIINQILVCILLTLRIYAIYGCSLRILAYLVGSGAVMIAIASWVMFGQKSAPSEQTAGCHIGVSSGTAIRLAGAWEALFVYDTIIFSLTIVKTWKARRDHAITGINVPLISLILRDGAIYFGVMAMCNLANILTFYLCGPFLRGSLSTFASSMAVTMMSRLMLNLHQTADLGIYSTQAASTNGDDMTPYTDDTLDIVHPSTISDAESTRSRRRKPR